jgi:hypothetical protein
MAAECATTAITRMARKLQVSTSGYYKRAKRSGPKELTDRGRRQRIDCSIDSVSAIGSCYRPEWVWGLQPESTRALAQRLGFNVVSVVRNQPKAGRIDDDCAHLERARADPGEPDLRHDLGDRLLRDLLAGSAKVRGDPWRAVRPAGVAMMVDDLHSQVGLPLHYLGTDFSSEAGQMLLYVAAEPTILSSGLKVGRSRLNFVPAFIALAGSPVRSSVASAATSRILGVRADGRNRAGGAHRRVP